MNIEQAKFNMVQQQVRPCEVLDKKILSEMTACPREIFVPDQYKSVAFADMQIPLPENQVMLSPIFIGKLLQAIQIKNHENVLEIGTGSGYLTALLARLAQKVTSIEIYRRLYEPARKRLQTLNLQNVEIINGDGLQQLQTQKTFDIAILTGSLPFLLPKLTNLVKDYGRIFLIVGHKPIMSAIVLTKKTAEQFHTKTLFEASVPTLVNIPIVEKFEF